MNDSLGDKNLSIYLRYILFTLVFAIYVTLWVISTINYCRSFYVLKYKEENDPDIDLTGLSDFKFVSLENTLEYSEGMSNLGTTGKIYFDCYEGICHYKKTYSCSKRKCTGSGDDKVCRYVTSTCHDYKSLTDKFCSLDCRINKKKECNINYCQQYYKDYNFDHSKCSRDDDSSDLSSEKSCNADNLILFWRGLYYERTNRTYYGVYKYSNSAILANETCPEGKKMCGILDELGNKLCYPINEICPINFLTLNLSKIQKYNYGIATLNGKIIYYTNEATETGKVVGGLFVDSDLLIKYKKEECEIIDEESISQLLGEHVNKLYRNSLNYNPYEDNNINEKGKSYLKWCIPGHGKEKNINIIKELNEVYKFNISVNKEIIKPIKTLFIASYFVCLPGFIGLFITFIFLLYFLCKYNINEEYQEFIRCKDCCFLTNFIFLIISVIFIITGSIISIANNKNLSLGNVKIDDSIFNSLYDINIISFSLFILLFFFMGFFFLYLFIITPRIINNVPKSVNNVIIKKFEDINSKENIKKYY